MVPVKLHKTFKARMEVLPADVKRRLLETLRRISDRPELRPDDRGDPESGEPCQVRVSQDCRLIYRVEYNDTTEILPIVPRVPLFVVATLETGGYPSPEDAILAQ